MNRTLKRILLALAVFLGLFMLLNWRYFWLHVSFSLRGPATSSQQGAVVQLPEPNVLDIPSLGIRVPVVYVDKVSERIYQEALRGGVVHFPGTAQPGAEGNAYIFGHSSDLPWAQGEYKTAFALLPRIERGAEVRISDRRGVVYTYAVTDKFVAQAGRIDLLKQGDGGKKLLTLQTSYPVGTAISRYVVIAEIK